MDIYEYETDDTNIVPAQTFIKPGKTEMKILADWRAMINEEAVMAYVNGENRIVISKHEGRMPDKIRLELVGVGWKVKRKFFGGYIITVDKNKTSP